MCGIVGLYLKNPAYRPRLGELFTPMLIAMSERGPDSAGFAIYGDEVPEGTSKLTLRSAQQNYNWAALAATLRQQLNAELEFFTNSEVAVFKVASAAEKVASVIRHHAPELSLLSAGQSIEILKALGLPAHIAKQFNLNTMQGSHIIGHTRMATESAV
ncbi:MAG: hypothetical protein KTR17_06360, partial [Cellvibrionaceae bacterium]|nr:hypothetical protein [Cellvibrionaceae bacterium]